MEGSEPAEPVAVCDTAGPHSKRVDRIATAEGATKLDDNLITKSSEGGHAAPNALHVTYIPEISEPGYRRLKRFLPPSASWPGRARITRVKPFHV
jgi:hypothetical protein